MKLPTWPTLRPLSKLTPTLYNAAAICPARALWTEYGKRDVFPSGPAAVLGQAFHAVVEEASRRNFHGDESARLEAANELFATRAQTAFDRSHPLVRWRWPSPSHLPNYGLLQAEAAYSALVFRGDKSPTDGHGRYYAERKLVSQDGKIEGRIDLIDTTANEVIDYKSGLASADEEPVKEHEARQLRLYAYLCAEHEIGIERGVIVRRDGQRNALPISAVEARQEADCAKALLTAINTRIAEGASVADLATPSEENCRFCPCRAICEPFWGRSTPEWAASTGQCAEGILEGIERREPATGATIQLALKIVRGTVSTGKRHTDAMPAILAEADGVGMLELGQTVRLIDLAQDNGYEVLRIRRHGLTTIWSC